MLINRKNLNAWLQQRNSSAAGRHGKSRKAERKAEKQKLKKYN